MKTVAAIVMLFMTLFICVDAIAQAGAQKTDGSLDAVKEKGVFVIGVDDSFPPMSFKDPKTGEYVGFDIDLARAAAKRMGLKLEMKPVSWNKIIPALNDGYIDAVWSGLTILPERKHQMAYSRPYLESRQVIVVKKGSKITRKEDLKDMRVGFEQGSSSERAIRTNPALTNTLKEAAAYPDTRKVFNDLAKGGIDAMIIDEMPARYMISREPDQFVIAAGDLGKEICGIGFRKSDIALRDALDTILADMAKDGTIDAAAKKWLGSTKPVIK